MTAPMKHAKMEGKPSEKGGPTEQKWAIDFASKTCEARKQACRGKRADRVEMSH